MANAFVGAGDVWLDRLTDAGVSQGMVKVGVGQLQIKPNLDLKEQLSKGRDSYGQVIASVAINKPAELEVELTEVDRKALAIAFLGVDSDYTLTSGSVTDEAVTAHLGLASKLAHRNVSSVVVKNSAGTVTYAVDTDYAVTDARVGIITVLNGGAITDGQSLKVSYSYGAEAGYKIRGAVQPIVRMAIMLDGKNLVDGASCFVTVYNAQVTPSNAVDFLSDNFATIKLKGTMVTPADKTEPFVVEMLA